MAAVSGPESAAPAEVDDGWLVEAYRSGMSTHQIARRLGMSRHRVSRRLRGAGVMLAPRGAGRRRDSQRLAEPPGLRARLEELYVRRRMTSGQIAVLLGWSERTVRNRLAELGIPTRTRGRANREDRRSLPANDVAELYVREGLSAADAGVKLGAPGRVVLRTAHDHGLPVRLGGHPPRTGPDRIELVDALYSDPLVADALARHRVPRVPAGGAISERFGRPVPLTAALLADLYAHCGLAASHVELLTGQPAATVLRHLHQLGLPLRPRGGRCPFRRRWTRQRPEHRGQGPTPRG